MDKLLRKGFSTARYYIFNMILNVFLSQYYYYSALNVFQQYNLFFDFISTCFTQFYLYLSLMLWTTLNPKEEGNINKTDK